MQDDCSRQEAGQIDLKLDHIIDTEDESADNACIEVNLLNVMTQGEMEILTKWFPKASKMLAEVLRNRLH